MHRNIIFGPPGTGKTTHLLRIVEKELRENKVNPNKIAYLAFTNQAADEALSRAISQLNYNTKDFMNFRTLHSLAYRELHLKEDNIMNDNDYNFLSNKLQIKLSNPNQSVKTYGTSFPDDVFMQVIDGAKIRGLTTENFFNDPNTGHLPGGILKLKYIDEALIKYKRARNKYDMTDMIVDFNQKHYDLMPNFDVVIIDEAQDLSWLQWKMVERIITNAKRVYVAGDDDQAIYRWAGARPEYLMNMEGTRTILNKSYRLSKLIHAKANNLIKRVKDRVDKEWTSRDEKGEVNIYPVEQLQKMKEGQWLILARDGYRLDKLEEELKIYGYYFARGDRVSINKRVQDAVLAWEDIRKGKMLDIKRVKSFYNYIKTGTGVAKEHKAMKNVDKEKLFSFDTLTSEYGLKVSKDLPWFKALENIEDNKKTYVRMCLRRKENIRRAPRIKLSTIHGSKGGEADNVMLLTDLTRKADAEYWRKRDEERRVFYVGMTRARNTLNIVRSQSDREFTEAF
jgi:DNA helicase-2/ATP-dependent DNA helicase PcrA